MQNNSNCQVLTDTVTSVGAGGWLQSVHKTTPTLDHLREQSCYGKQSHLVGVHVSIFDLTCIQLHSVYTILIVYSNPSCSFIVQTLIACVHLQQSVASLKQTCLSTRPSSLVGCTPFNQPVKGGLLNRLPNHEIAKHSQATYALLQPIRGQYSPHMTSGSQSKLSNPSYITWVLSSTGLVANTLFRHLPQTGSHCVPVLCRYAVVIDWTERKGSTISKVKKKNQNSLST